jgi:hypothetical protein
MNGDGETPTTGSMQVGKRWPGMKTGESPQHTLCRRKMGQLGHQTDLLTFLPFILMINRGAKNISGIVLGGFVYITLILPSL